MSVRDEISEMLYGDAWNSVRAQREVSSIMPIVERVALESARQMAGYCVAELAPSLIMPTEKLLEAADRIAQSVMEGGQ